MPEETKQAAAPERPRLWTPVFVLIIALSLCCFIMGQGLNAGTTVFLEGQGYGTSLAGALALVFSAAAAFTRLAVGPAIDGGKCSLVILLGIAVLVAGTFLSVVASGVPMFVLCRVLQGVGFAASTTAAATAAADVLPAARLGEGIGYHGLGQALAMSIGPALAIFLVGTDPSTNLYVGLSLVGVVGFVIALNARYERKAKTLPATCAYLARMKQQAAARESGAARLRLRDSFNIFEPAALPGAIPMAVLCPTFGFGIFFMGAYGNSLGFENAGLFYTVSAISMISVRLASRSFMDRVVAIKTYTVAVLCALVAYVMLFFCAGNQPLYLLAAIFYGLALGISLPLNQSVAVKNTPSERWGATNALFLLMNDVGIGLASVVWGIVNDTLGFQVSIVAVMVCVVSSYVVAWVCYPKRDKTWR